MIYIGRIFSRSDFKELIKSCSKLFKEILYSDYRNAFINKFEKELATENSTLLNNLVYIMVSNSKDNAINKILTSLLNKNKDNEKVIKAIYQIEWKGFVFQKIHPDQTHVVFESLPHLRLSKQVYFCSEPEFSFLDHPLKLLLQLLDLSSI